MKIYFVALLFLLSINNSYSQWIIQSTPADITTILSMDFIDPQNGAGAGNTFQNNFSGKAIYTTNAGVTWLSATVPDSSRSLVTMQFVNSTTGYSVGAYDLFFNNKFISENDLTKIYSSGFFRNDFDFRIGIKTESLGEYRGLFFRTTDRGVSWNTYGNLPDSIYYLTGLHFLNETTGFATASFDYSGGVDYRIIKTTNGGSTWLHLPMPDVISSLRNIFFTDDNNGFAVGYKVVNDTPRAIILTTINSGSTWTLQIFPDMVNFNDVHFTNSLTGFVTGSAGLKFVDPQEAVIFRTTNGGINWHSVAPVLNDVFLYSIKFVPGTGVGFASGSKGDNFSNTVVFTTKTTDYGQSWVNHSVNYFGFSLCNFLLDENNWYMGNLYSDHSFVLHSTNGGTGITTINNSVPDNFKLYQNYPNPFNPLTKIKFQISKSELVNLTVYDILGKEISTIINERLQPGNYEADIDGTNLISGIYLYKITAGEFSEVRKMLLIK